MNERKPLDGAAVVIMVVLCIAWGLQQVAIKVAAPSLAPVVQIAWRSAIAAGLVYGLTLWRRETFSLRDGTLWPGIAAGVLFTGEFLCVSLGLGHTSASHMAVFLYTAPIFTALGLHWLVPSERLHARQWAGVLVAFGGMALAFADGLGAPAGTLADTLYGDALGGLGGLSWAATTILIRRSTLSEAPPTQTLLYQLVVCTVLLLVIAGRAAWPGAVTMTGIAWASLLFQAVLISFVSFLAWFWMMRRYLTAQLSVFSFLTPLFGVTFGVLLLHEPVGTWFIAGAGLVLAGICLVNRRPPVTVIKGEPSPS
ncbi:MAG: DMT family transporter [Candidatus Sericytochromatia bacterium]|nr:DMT family transporter [Candidatus Sericytochromatia bacterium]